MFRRILGICLTLAFATAIAPAADNTSSQVKLSAPQIADKNVAARGGLQAWRAVQTMELTGKLGAGGNRRAALPVPDPTAGHGLSPQTTPARLAEEAQLPFVMDLKRPRKMRFEVQFAGQTAVQVYDGANGWKLRPFLNRLEVEPYTAEEMKIASMQADLDGPLVDYAAKGTRVELDGMDKVEGRDAYKLKLTMQNGQVLHDWIDAQSFLETKIEGQPRRLDGAYHPVEIYFRDYRQVSGLQIPFLLETRVLPVPVDKTKTVHVRNVPVPPEKITVEKIAVNPKVDDSCFSKPEVAGVSNVKKSAG